jgi:hypothetical protein
MLKCRTTPECKRSYGPAVCVESGCEWTQVEAESRFMGFQAVPRCRSLSENDPFSGIQFLEYLLRTSR